MATDSVILSSRDLQAAEIPLESLKRFSVDEYHVLIDAGFFANDESYELLEGLLVHKMGKNRRHTLVTQRLREFLEGRVAGYYVDAQEPVATSDSEPEPDVSVIRGKREDYLDQQPPAENVAFVAEISWRTLGRDRGLKKRIYARAGIPVYWIINLMDEQIEVYSRPTGAIETPNYDQCQILKSGDELPVIIDGREVGRLAVKDLLP